IAGAGAKTYTISYDEDDYIEKIEDPAGRETLFSVDANGDLESITTPSLCVTSYTYDGSHQLTSITSPEGYTTSFTLDGDVRTIENPNGDVTTLTCTDKSSAPLEVKIEDPLGNVTTVARDAAGDPGPSTIIDPLGRTNSFTYSAYHPETSADGAGASITYTYAANGALESATNALGKTSSYSYDGNNFVDGIVDALGNRVTYTNDSSGNRLTVTDPAGNTTTMTYTAAGLVETMTDALDCVATYTYNGDNLLQTYTNALGDVTTYILDAWGNSVAGTGSTANDYRYIGAVGPARGQRDRGHRPVGIDPRLRGLVALLPVSRLRHQHILAGEVHRVLEVRPLRQAAPVAQDVARVAYAPGVE
ncbi:MAG TPA: hypothetical protein QGH10_00525, partial [Armatimonadota bacterium]|nr:hypothetical protein [Armatimonadota bacterium]